MILETAHLHIKPGQTAAFEAAFSQARSILSASPGFIDLQLQRCIEDDHHYLLLVRSQTLEDHTVGFRQSEPYQRWKALLHHFYDAFPQVLHFAGAMNNLVTLDLPEDMLRAAGAMAMQRGISLSELVAEFVRLGLREGDLSAPIPQAA